MRHFFSATSASEQERHKTLTKAAAAFVFAFAIASSAHIASAQASVPESYQTLLYVDANIGQDTNLGTQAAPVRTLAAATSKALSFNSRGLSTKVIVNPGIYRETLTLGAQYKHTTATVAFEAAQPGTAVISGSDVFTNWYQGTSNPAIYTHPWGYNFGLCAEPAGWPAGLAPVVLRREMVFINGQPLTQVIDPSQMIPGTFFVDDNAGLLQVWPVPGTNMSTALVEVATRPETVDITNRTNTVLRGLVLRHAASCINFHGANVTYSSNVLIDGVQANWNNWGGLSLHYSTNTTIQNSSASYNGGVGLASFEIKNALYQNDETDYNNWRGAQGALYDWGMGGMKLMLVHNATVNQFSSFRNHAQGLWFDTDNRNIVVNGASVSQNELANLQVELNYGPIAIQNSAFCAGTLGLNLINSSNISLSGNAFYNNGFLTGYQGNLYLAGKAGGRSFTDWETGVFYNVISSNLTMTGNQLQNGGPQQRIFTTYQTGTDWTAFTSTLVSNNNQWYDPLQTNPYVLGGGKKFTFTGWQAQTGQDLQSVWSPAQAAQSCSVPDPTAFDFAVHADNRTYTMVNGQTTVNLNLRPYNPSVSSMPLSSRSAAVNPLTLQAAALPAGVTATFGPPALTPYGLNSTLVLTAAKGTVAQTVPVTILAQSGNQVHTVTVAVSVVPPM